MTILGIDLGMGNMKAWGPHGGVILPSHIALDTGRAFGSVAGVKSKERPLKVNAYFVGLGAHDFGWPVENMSYDRLLGSTEVKILLYGVLTEYMHTFCSDATLENMTIAVGLPLDLAKEPGAQEHASILREWLEGWHAWEADGAQYQADIRRVLVTSQAAAAWQDYILQHDGNVDTSKVAAIRGEVGVISIGSKTVESMWLQRARLIENKTRGVAVGVSDLLAMASRDSLYTLGELDEQLRAKTLDVSGYIKPWARKVLGANQSAWGETWRRLAAVLIVGGGAMLLNGELSVKFGAKAHVPDDPIMSIARGLYKYAVMFDKREG